MPSAVCSSCSKGYRVPDEAAGKKFKCKNCGGVIQVPAPAVAVAVKPVTPVVKPVMKAAAKPMVAVAKPRKVAAPPPPPVYAETDDGDADLDDLASLETGGVVDNSIPFIATQAAMKTTKVTRASAIAKSKPAKSGSGFKLGFHLSRLPVMVIGLGLGLAIWGGEEALLASGASDTPQDITCADLAANGPGNNAHVRVTDFKSMSNFIYRKSANGDWDTVWLPIIPPNAVVVPKGKRLIHSESKAVSKDIVDSSVIHVLIKTHTVHSQGDVESAMNRDSVEGLVINKIEHLNEKERELLRNAYPLMDVDTVCIVEEGRQPNGGTGMLGLIGGIALILGGLVLIFKPN
jgi:hypothetical protein